MYIVLDFALACYNIAHPIQSALIIYLSLPLSISLTGRGIRITAVRAVSTVRLLTPATAVRAAPTEPMVALAVMRRIRARYWMRSAANL